MAYGREPRGRTEQTAATAQPSSTSAATVAIAYAPGNGCLSTSDIPAAAREAAPGGGGFTRGLTSNQRSQSAAARERIALGSPDRGTQRVIPHTGYSPDRQGNTAAGQLLCGRQEIGSQVQKPTRKRSIHMNGTTVRSGMLNKIVAFWRAGYAPDAPQHGHIALLAMCPAAARVVRPSASGGFVGDRRA